MASHTREEHGGVVSGTDLGLVVTESVQESVWITDNRNLVPGVPGYYVHQRNSHIQHSKQLQSVVDRT